jgi:hypothetical protein
LKSHRSRVPARERGRSPSNRGSEIHDQSYQKLTNRDKFDPGSGFRARRTKLPTRDERSDEAKNFADRRKVVAPPNLASAARKHFLKRKTRPDGASLIPTQTCQTMSKPAVVFGPRAAHVDCARARVRPCPRRRPLACAERYHLRVSDASYNDVGTIERDRAPMGISQAPRAWFTSSGR